MSTSSSIIGGGMVRSIGKIGKRLCFPSAPSIWVSTTVEGIQRSQDCRPKSEVLFPYPRDRDRTKDEDDEGGSGSGSYTCPPMRVSDKEYLFCSYSETVSKFLRSQSQIPEYDDDDDDDLDSTAACSSTIEIGKQFDVVSLLAGPGAVTETENNNNNTQLYRLNGDTVELQHLIGKNVMVFCVHVPVYWISDEASYIRELPLVCRKAFSGNNNYEVVIVPRMRRDWATDQDAFNHFLSGFPSSWLAIPFSHPLRRNSVCKSLGLTSPNKSRCLFVDHTQKVLLHGSSGACYDENNNINRVRVPWWKNSQLHAILGCNPSDYVYKINLNPAPNPNPVSISISELNNKLVGLYMCKDGSFIRTLNLVHQECKSKGMDFEIVLIYLPVCDDYVNPQLFQDAVNHVLHDFKIDDWWILPHDDFRFHRFKNDRRTFSADELIIVGPHNEFVDPYGKQVISCFGFNAYPFTCDHVVEKQYQEIRALTLEHLLGDRFLFNDHDEVTAQGLRGKTVLLYMDSAHSLKHSLYFQLLEWYFTNRATRKSFDFEVVFVDLDEYGDAPLHMPWRWCSFDPQHAAFLNSRLGNNRGLVAFGKDGQILTLYAEKLLQSCDPDGIESYKGLRNDVHKSVQLDFVINQVEFDD